jgi:hypothetical protein
VYSGVWRSPGSRSHDVTAAKSAQNDTLFSTASGVSGLVAGPSWAFQPQDYRVRPLSSLRPALAGADLRTRLRHVCNRRSASLPSTTGSAIAFGDAFAQCNGSDLLTLRLPFAYKLAVLFLTSPTFRKLFYEPCQDFVYFPMLLLSLCTFRCFSLG